MALYYNAVKYVTFYSFCRKIKWPSKSYKFWFKAYLSLNLYILPGFLYGNFTKKLV
jgi:hypothetical protein